MEAKQFIFIWFVLILLYFSVPSKGLNTRPIIGIIAEPTYNLNNNFSRIGQYYIVSSYAKWIEAAGARVVPVITDGNKAQLEALAAQINGLLLPGGAAPIVNTVYWKSLRILFDYASSINDKGDYFPIWGTCEGFQELGVLSTPDNYSILTEFNSENYVVPLIFTSEHSRLFSKASSPILDILSSQNSTFNNHHGGIGLSTFQNNNDLKSFWRMISWNYDRDGKQFVSTMESYSYPFYASQWHPEKISFEWDPNEIIPHESTAVLANMYPNWFFVSEAQKNNHTFKDQNVELQSLIYNYPLIYTYHLDPEYETTYFFN